MRRVRAVLDIVWIKIPMFYVWCLGLLVFLLSICLNNYLIVVQTLL